MTLTVGALWRYPVKTVAGERLYTAEITTNGIVGDRIVHVRGPEGVRTSQRHHNLLGLHATLGSDGEPRVDGQPWNSAEILDRVRATAGPDATELAEAYVDHRSGLEAVTRHELELRLHAGDVVVLDVRRPPTVERPGAMNIRLILNDPAHGEVRSTGRVSRAGLRAATMSWHTRPLSWVAV